jgi:hypothetical protein
MNIIAASITVLLCIIAYPETKVNSFVKIYLRSLEKNTAPHINSFLATSRGLRFLKISKNALKRLDKAKTMRYTNKRNSEVAV